MSQLSRYWLAVLILLLGAGLQLRQATQDQRFHPDEAFYTTFARNAAVNGNWMLPGALDKPPVSIYTNALALTFFAVHTNENDVLDLDIYQGEFAARLPNVFASLFILELLYAITQTVCRKPWVSLLAMLFGATSPYWLAFGATAFTDMLLLAWLLLALWCALQRKWSWAGFWWVIAFATKPQAIYVFPLIVGISIIWNQHNRQQWWRQIRALLLPILIGVLILVVWDAARPETSVFELGAANNTSDQFWTPLGEHTNRLIPWLDYGRHLFNLGILGIVLCIIGIVQSFRIQSRLTLLCLAWIMCYIGWHIITSLNVYDRYLLLILPVIVIWQTVGLVWLYKQIIHVLQVRKQAHVQVPVFLLFVLSFALISSLHTPHNINSIGGDKGDHQGIDLAANHLNTKPVATVVYDRWLGWELGYYMGQWHDKRIVFHPSPTAMVTDALTLNEIGDRYFPVPNDEAVESWLQAFQDAGFIIHRDFETERFTIYRLIPP